jgi:acetyl-CoA C-acetyltransferase
MRDVAVIGVGITKFGELWDKSFRQLIAEAGSQAIYDSNISGSEIDALYVGSMSAGRFIGQEHVGALVADCSGFSSVHIPSIRVESACASGGVAFRQGYFSVASGMNDVVVIGGVEKMTDVVDNETTNILATGLDQEWEAFFGATFPGIYAMIATKHMHDYGTTREQLAQIAVKNHANGALNPFAQFKREIKLESVLKAPTVAYPLGMLDCSPVSDGAAALILCEADKAKKYTDKSVKISGSGQASDTLALHGRNDICTFESAKYAARMAYKRAGLKPKDIDVAEVHDCFTIAEILAIEDLEFVKKGEGGKAISDKITTLDGRIPVNPSGGLKAKGHPIGATGVAQIAEIVLQLRGEADKRQVKDAKIGLTHNVGAGGASCVVNILEVI